MASTYSYKSIVGAFSHPDAGVFPFQGQEGVKQITVSNANDRTAHDRAADGLIMVSYVPGADGAVTIEMQQNSSLHQFLLEWANGVFTQADQGNAANFAAAAVRIQDLLSGDSHTLTGVSPTKIPDKPYADRGGNVTWVLMAAQVVNQ